MRRTGRTVAEFRGAAKNHREPLEGIWDGGGAGVLANEELTSGVTGGYAGGDHGSHWRPLGRNEKGGRGRQILVNPRVAHASQLYKRRPLGYDVSVHTIVLTERPLLTLATFQHRLGRSVYTGHRFGLSVHFLLEFAR